MVEDWALAPLVGVRRLVQSHGVPVSVGKHACISLFKQGHLVHFWLVVQSYWDIVQGRIEFGFVKLIFDFGNL